jgi:hypothetical protein
MDLLKTLYGVIGAPYPMLTVIIASLIGTFLFGGGWWLIGKQYNKEMPISSGKIVSQNISKQQDVISPPNSFDKKQSSVPTLKKVKKPQRNETDNKSINSVERQRSVAIKIVGGKNITIKNHVGIGTMDLIDAENVENLDADNNILINPNDQNKK